MGLKAARVGDFHECKLSDGPKPHVGGALAPPGALTVLIGNQPAARVGETAICMSPAPNKVIQGEPTVKIGGMPAARKGDKTAHGGEIKAGCGTVEIGTPYHGDLLKALKMCADAAKGRASGKTQQSYDNCGVESSRQIVNQMKGTKVTEKAMLKRAQYGGLAANQPGNIGGTSPAKRQQILKLYGVQSSVQSSTVNNIMNAIGKGKGVIASVDAGVLWGVKNQVGQGHAINVVGVKCDANGNPTHVVINDSGTGECGQAIPIARWNKAVQSWPAAALNVTVKPI